MSEIIINGAEPKQPTADEVIVARCQELRVMAINAVNSADSCYDFAMACRAFFMNFGPILQSLVESDTGKAKIAKALTIKTLGKETEEFFDRIKRAHIADHFLLVMNNSKVENGLAGIGNLKTFEDLPANIGLLVSYITCMRALYEQPLQGIKADTKDMH